MNTFMFLSNDINILTALNYKRKNIKRALLVQIDFKSWQIKNDYFCKAPSILFRDKLYNTSVNVQNSLNNNTPKA